MRVLLLLTLLISGCGSSEGSSGMASTPHTVDATDKPPATDADSTANAHDTHDATDPAPDVGFECPTIADSETVVIPAGRAQIGCSGTALEEWSGACAQSAPAYTKNLQAFEIQTREVTVEQYIACMEAEQCGSPTCDNPECRFWQAQNAEGSTNVPIDCLLRLEVRRLCSYFGMVQCSGEQWERAARGPGIGASPGLPAACEPEWGTLQSDVMRPVGTTMGDVTPEGVADMYGNAAEAVNSFWLYHDTMEGPATFDDPYEDLMFVARGGRFAAPAPAWYRVPVRGGCNAGLGVRCCRWL